MILEGNLILGDRIMKDKKLLALGWKIPACNSDLPMKVEVAGELDIENLPFIDIPYIPAVGLSYPDKSLIPSGFTLAETFWVDNKMVFAKSTLARSAWQFLEYVKVGKYYAVIVDNDATIHIAAFDKLGG